MKAVSIGILGAILGIVIGVLLYKSYTVKSNSESSDIVIEHIKSVKKLVVTEGYFSEVYSYKEEDELYEYFGINKKALLIVKGKAQVSYDLEKIDYQVDEESKTITLINVPAPEISIEPEIKYYDLQEFMINSFTTEEHNKMNARAIGKLKEEINKSDLKAMARNRLEETINDLQFVGKEMGWKVVWPKT